jgi:glycosyltransferase involved in cell wall biosynthesis
MSFVRELYSGLPSESFSKVGVWFDLYYTDGEKALKAVGREDKQKIKQSFIQKIKTENPDIIHLNSYALDKDCVKFLEEYKKENPSTKIVYTAHSLAFQDFERDPYERKLFSGIDKNLLAEVVNLADLHFQSISEEEKEKKILKILRNFGIPASQERLESLKIRSYMIGLQKRLMGIADENVFVSEFLRESSKSMHGVDGKVIENGVSIGETYENYRDEIERARIKWRERYHRDGDLLIGYVGRITESKGIFDLINAFKRLSKEMNNVYLYFSGPYTDETLEKLAKEAGRLFGERVFFFKKDTLPEPFGEEEKIGMSKIYRVFDLVVYPSNYEPFGLVPLEAISCGVPTLVRDVDNLSTFVKQGLCEGFEDDADLYRKMKEMLLNIDDHKKSIIEKKEIVRKRYYSSSMRKNYKKLFGEMFYLRETP